MAITDTLLFSDPPSESERIDSTVIAFFEAAGDGDFERACGLLTKGAQDVMQRAAARAVEGADEMDCPQIMEGVVGDSFAEVSFRMRPGTNVSGNRARAEVALKEQGELAIFRTILLELSENGERWLISDFG